MTFSFELMDQPRYVAGRFVRQPFLHFGERELLLDQEHLEDRVETVKTRWTRRIGHGIVRVILV